MTDLWVKSAPIAGFYDEGRHSTKPARVFLPCCFAYFGWVLAWVVITGCGVVTILYGFRSVFLLDFKLISQVCFQVCCMCYVLIHCLFSFSSILTLLFWIILVFIVACNLIKSQSSRMYLYVLFRTVTSQQISYIFLFY